MNWIRENKFLTGYLVVLIIGVIVLAILLFTSWSKNSTNSAQYNHQVAELHRLQGLAPYPDQKNLTALKTQKSDYIQQVEQLQTKLEGMQAPVEKTSPEEFQSKLHEAVLDIRQKAGQNGVKLDDKFYLGFDLYRNELPSESQAAGLARELDAIHFVVSDMVGNKIVELKSVSRLPQSSLTTSPSKTRRPRLRSGRSAHSAKTESMQHRSFVVNFTTDQPQFRKVLNDISTASKRFYVIRNIKALNEKQEPPSRSDGSAFTPSSGSGSTDPAPAQQPAAPTTAAATSGQGSSAQSAAKKPPVEDLHPVLGTEKLNVTMQIDIFNFAGAEKD